MNQPISKHKLLFHLNTTLLNEITVRILDQDGNLINLVPIPGESLKVLLIKNNTRLSKFRGATVPIVSIDQLKPVHLDIDQPVQVASWKEFGVNKDLGKIQQQIFN